MTGEDLACRASGPTGGSCRTAKTRVHNANDVAYALLYWLSARLTSHITSEITSDLSSEGGRDNATIWIPITPQNRVVRQLPLAVQCCQHAIFRHTEFFWRFSCLKFTYNQQDYSGERSMVLFRPSPRLGWSHFLGGATMVVQLIPLFGLISIGVAVRTNVGASSSWVTPNGELFQSSSARHFLHDECK